MESEINTFIERAKRSCTHCFAHQKFNPNPENKESAIKSTKEAVKLFRNKFDELRKQDASVEEINNVKKSKTLCLDAIDECEKCGKDSPKLKEKLLEIQN